MDDVTVADQYGDSLSLARATTTGSPLIAIWATNNENVAFHFTEDQARDLINEIAEVIMEIRRDG